MKTDEYHNMLNAER